MSAAATRILGIDPGLNITGYGVLEVARGGVKICEAGVVRGQSKGSLALRLAEIHAGVADVIASLSPAAMAVEQLYSHYKHPRTAILMGKTGAGRAEAEARKQHKPEEDAEDVPVRREQRVLDQVAQEFRSRQLARIEMTPFAEQAPGFDLVAVVESCPDVGEIVAELAKAHGQIQHQHAEQQGKQGMDVMQQPVQPYRAEQGQ